MMNKSTLNKASGYNFIKMHEGNMIIYNTKTGAVAIIEENQVQDYKFALENPNCADYKEQISNLRTQGFVVDENLDEFLQIKEWHEKAMAYPNYIQITMLPNENCNFRCPYCFVYTHRGMVMEDTTYESVLNYIKKTCENTDEKVYLTLVWFGGEPLLSTGKIIEFMKKLKELENEYGMITKASVITNGYLLSPKVFQEMVDSGIEGFQVTIDGRPEVHNKLRPLVDGSPTYDVIYRNIKEISSLPSDYKFAIRVNFLKDRLEEMEKFADQLLNDFGKDSRFKIYFRPIYYFETSRDDISSILDKICNETESIEIQNKLEFKIMKSRGDTGERRIANPLPMPALSWCGTEWYNAFMVGADGSIFFCDTMADKKHSMGKILHDGSLEIEKGLEIWKKSIFEEESMKNCFDCILLPICLGGCRRNRIEQGKPDCFWTKDDIYNAMVEFAKIKI